MTARTARTTAQAPANPIQLPNHEIVSRSEWLLARKRFLDDEKQLTRLRDELSEKRRALPWVKVETPYVFEGPKGKQPLSSLFAGRNQLVVYHFMFAPEWEAGCKHCSFWADNFNGVVPHLNQRDITFAAISRAPLAKLEAFKKRLGWTFEWFSSGDNGFNHDYAVSFSPDELAKGDALYNYGAMAPPQSDMPGISVFTKGVAGYADDDVFHTYSSFGRGIEVVNSAYQWIDLTPKGRDEGQRPMAWVKLRDQYER
jgi:predicted dithiol-disulfide oxidoreductase (DUF899 family)